VLLVQLALGGWVSTNYATLACTDFPLCNGKLVPEMDFEHGFTLWRELGKTAAGHYLPFSALTAIHWVHRNFAAVVALVLGYTAWRAWDHAGLHRTARNMALVLAVQLAHRHRHRVPELPAGHRRVAQRRGGLLVLLVTMLNYKVSTNSTRRGSPSAAPSGRRRRPATISMMTQTATHKPLPAASQYWALTKPRVTQLAVFCAVIGMFLATDGFPGWHVLICRHDRHLAAGRRRLRRQLPDRAESTPAWRAPRAAPPPWANSRPPRPWCSPPSSAAPAWACCTRWSTR
jgi:hypothetical protein